MSLNCLCKGGKGTLIILKYKLSVRCCLVKLLFVTEGKRLYIRIGIVVPEQVQQKPDMQF
jgi:hypothetical protein